MSAPSLSLAKLRDLLVAADGAFVRGQALCTAIGIPMLSLSNFINQLRVAYPDVAIEGKRGWGYRLIDPSDAAEPQTEFDPPRKPRPLPKAAASMAAHVKMKSVMQLLDALAPQTAEVVKIIALESGETCDQTIARLISYGAEVHRDLVGKGESPFALSTPNRAGARA